MAYGTKSPLDQADRNYVLQLMANVAPDQAWGMSSELADNAQVELKNGWLELDTGWVQDNNTSLSADEQTLAHDMITLSDNQATTTLLNTYQGGYTAPNRLFNQLGMTHTKMSTAAWGLSTTTQLTHQPDSELKQQWQDILTDQDANVNIAVYNHKTNQTTAFSNNTSATYYTASIIKVAVLANLLNNHATSNTATTLEM
ncbi:hypothetical protein GQS40_01655|uniref:Serine hydrolase n=1 Tax=Leuconostoc lactis TaxID=1246 RepID=A0A6L7A8Y6_LEULA|nr:hypothetical protein [Leuconostoc lactis]